MSGNRKYKDSVFALLFGEKEILIELYNAVSGSSYTPDTDVIMTTLENALFLGKINDIAFKLENRFIIMIEHQSTLPVNLPLRMLQYISRIYEMLIEPENVYRITQVKIPSPEFLVLYNGPDDFPDEKTVYLSDAFIDGSKRNLELTVRILNINKGHNEKILQKSEHLNGYAVLIDRVRANQKNGMNLDAALTEAVKYCREQNILKEFLHKNGSEVVNMLFAEFNMDDAKRIWREDGEITKAMKVAEKLLRKRLSIEEISEITELTQSEIMEIKEKMKN